LNVAKYESEAENKEKNAHQKIDIDAKNKVSLDEADNINFNDIRITSLFATHFVALIYKRMVYFSRDTRGFVCEVFLPFIIVIAGLSILLINFIIESPP